MVAIFSKLMRMSVSPYTSSVFSSTLFRRMGMIPLFREIRRAASTNSAGNNETVEEPNQKEILDNPKIEKLLLHNFHQENGAKFTNFKGFALPLNYADAQLTDEVFFSRKMCSAFDASYRPQFSIYGDDVSKIMEGLVTADLQELKQNQAVRTLMTNPQGGIIDDLVVTKISDTELHIVANTPKVLEEIKKNTQVEILTSRYMNLITFQGPECSKLLQLLIMDGVQCLPLFHSLQAETVLWGQAHRVTRCSDVGEDGFMVSMPSFDARDLLSYVIFNNIGDIRLIGLKAREAMRIEAGHCLSGVDYDQQITPVQARLEKLIGKRRRIEGKFPGADIILKELQDKSNPIVRIGFIANGSCKVGAPITDAKGNYLGKVTSSSFSPCLKTYIGMGYVATEFAEDGKELVFNKDNRGFLAELPFVKRRSYTNVNLF